MIMSYLRVVITLGQLGKIWAETAMNKKIFQSISVIAYFYLMESMNNSSTTNITLDNSFYEKEPEVKIIYKKLKFNKPW